MADNVIADPGTGGATFRTFAQVTSGVEWAASVNAYVSGGSAGAWTLQEVDATHGLPVTVVGSVAVTGTFWQTTQPVSIAASVTVIGTGTFVTQATLSAETTKVIGTVNISASQTVGLVAGSAVIGHVIVDAGTAVIGHVIVDSGTITTVSTVTTVSTLTSLSQFAGAAINLGTGNSSTGTLRVVLATDQPALTNKLLVTPDAGSTVSLVPATSGGLSIYSVITSGAANQDAAAIKGSAGQVYGYSLFNTTASARYVKLYNLASGATSAGTPVVRIYLPPTGGANLSMEQGLAFGTGISIRITTGAADSDTGSCSANDVLANVFWK